MEVYLKKGAPITCPCCFYSVLRMAKDVSRNDTIMAGHVEIQEKYVGKFKRPKNGDFIQCLNCGETFLSIVRSSSVEGRFA